MRRALLGLVDHRPQDLLLGASRGSVSPDRVYVRGARNYHFDFKGADGAFGVVPVYPGLVMTREHLTPLLQEGLALSEGALTGPPDDAFAPLQAAEKADNLSFKFHSAGAQAEYPWRTGFGEFGLNFHEGGIMSLSHAGVIFAWQQLTIDFLNGERLLSFDHSGRAVNQNRALMGLPPIKKEHLRWALRSAAFAHIGHDAASLAFPAENEISDEALRLGF